jgi:small subunit ribosomal protein S20
MPIIKSAKKRVRVAKKAAARNSRTKRSMRSSVKGFQSKPTDVNFRKAQSDLDKAVKKGVISKNKAARKKRQLIVAAKAAGVKPAKKTAAKQTPAKKPATKKPVRQAQGKPAAKKAPASLLRNS